MIRRILLVIVLLCLLPGVAHAETNSSGSKTFGLKVTPLEFRTTIEKGKFKKGFVDISNPMNEALQVTTSVQGFRQISDDGALQFFDDEQITAGVKLDLDSFELPARSALRMYFALDSTKLPSGDVYAAIFFSTTQPTSTQAISVQPAVRVGTLLSVVNGTPGTRSAEITDLSTSWFHFGEVKGSYAIKNTANTAEATGFYPDVSLSLDPLHQQITKNSSLLFPGRERTNSFTVKPNFPGIYKLTASFGDTRKSRYILVLTTSAIITAAILVAALIIVIVFLRRRMNTKRPRSTKLRRR